MEEIKKTSAKGEEEVAALIRHQTLVIILKLMKMSEFDWLVSCHHILILFVTKQHLRANNKLLDNFVCFRKFLNTEIQIIIH